MLPRTATVLHDRDLLSWHDLAKGRTRGTLATSCDSIPILKHNCVLLKAYNGFECQELAYKAHPDERVCLTLKSIGRARATADVPHKERTLVEHRAPVSTEGMQRVNIYTTTASPPATASKKATKHMGRAGCGAAVRCDTGLAHNYTGVPT